MTNRVSTVIVGGGLSGLTVAHTLRQNSPNHSFLVIEQSDSPGGVIRTHRENGYIAEIGPHGFLDNCRESQQILEETGLDRETVKAPLIEFVRYVYLHQRLNLIPQTPRKIILAPLISWPAKLRVLKELFVPVLDGEPTVAKWINHRFGPAMLPFFDAVFTGTYAGDYDRLTIDSVMPGLRNLEKQYGSVLRGSLSRLWESRKTKDNKPRFTMPAMTSFPNGMSRLVERLSEPLSRGRDLLTGCRVTSIHHAKDGWSIETTGDSVRCSNLVLAIPVNPALELLTIPSIPKSPLPAIPQAWIATVAMGFRDTVQIPPGFGFLTPEVAKRFSLGCLFSSNMFPGRAPEGNLLIETLVGGRRHPERLELPEDELIALAVRDVTEILGISQRPVYTRLIRSDGGIPQLEKSYPALLRWKKNLATILPNLHLCGFGWDGIGLNDMMKHATKVARNIIKPMETGEKGAEVKGIYF